MKYYDKEQFYCMNCGHKWILISDKPITNKQHWTWIKDTIIEHAKISEEENG